MIKSKNICITINSLDSGGAEKQALLLAKAIKPYHKTFLVILNSEPIYPPRLEVIEKEELNHIYLSKKPLTKAVDLIRFLKKEEIDIIFSFLPMDTMLSAICGKLARVPHIFGGIRNSHVPWIKYTGLKLINNYLLNYTIANNYSAYVSSIEFGFRNRVFVVPNGIEIKPIIKNRSIDKKTITIISVGRLVKQKDYATALKSIAHVKLKLGKSYDIKYIIVGQGPEQTNITYDIENYGLRDNVDLITKPLNIYDLLESSDIYLCTSTFEGISNSIMEAMNSTLPIVATNAGDNSRLVVNKKNGFITDIKEHKKLAEHICFLIDYPEKRNEMGFESYKHLIEYYSYEAFQKKYLKIIQNVNLLQIKDGEINLFQENIMKIG